jgi:mitotic spindle assembly checkpoint protein MAD2B
VVDKNYAPVERFVFDIQTLVDPKAGNDQTTQDTAMTAEDIEVYLRAFLRKISVCDSVLRPNPPECTFALVLQLRDGTPTAIKHGFPWVPDDQSSDGTIVGQPSSTHIPLKTMNTGLVKVHFFVEETSFKETPVATSG